MSFVNLSLKDRTWILLGTLSVLMITDYLLTSQFLAWAGPAGEGNPLMRTVFMSMGSKGILYFKLEALLVTAILLFHSPVRRWIFAVFVALNLIYLYPIGLGFFTLTIQH